MRISLVLLLALLIVSCGVRENNGNTTSFPQVSPDRTSNISPIVVTPNPQAQASIQNIDQSSTPTCKLTPSKPIETLTSVRPLDAITFSEPQVVFIGNIVGIAEWLPDSQMALISTRLLEKEADSIEILDVSNHNSSQLASHKGDRTIPLWLESINSVVFVEKLDKNEIVLKVVRPSDANIIVEASGLLSPYIAVAPKGRGIIYVDTAGLSKLTTEVGQDSREVVARQEALLAPPSILSAFTRSVWSPDSQRVLLFNNRGTNSSVFVLDLLTQSVCSFLWSDQTSPTAQDWMVDAKWSPNGQYLAFVTVRGEVGRLERAVLNILNIATGIVSPIKMETQYVYEFEWMPSGTQLLALGKVEPIHEITTAGLYFADIENYTATRVLPNSSFATGIYGFQGGGLSVAPDGGKVLTICPDWGNIDPTRSITNTPICLINITSK